MAGKHNVGVTVSAKDLASGVIQKVSARTVALGVALGKLASKLIAGAVNGVRRWIDEALEAERANVMLDAALRGTGQYTDEVARKMKDLAGAIQDETGASDEAVKANIAMLTTMGVTTDKMGEAARAVQALAALNFEGSQAAKAVALAMEGNMLGFQRMIPALRNATSETEKVEAVNKVLAAGYEQQRANLKTVGGAWEALKGRIGDAREEIIGAVFEGLKLGQTFDSMQAAVGRFLKSDTFKDFTERLKSGADYVTQIVKAMSVNGGTKEVLAAMGNVILAALKDGADYVGAKISEAFGKFNYVGRAARFWGAKSAGASTEEALRARDNALLGGKGGGNLKKALEQFDTIVKTRAAIHKESAVADKQALDSTVEQVSVQLDITKAIERDRDAIEKAARADEARAQHAANIKAIQADIEAAAERERQAQDKAAKLQEQRRDAIKMNINDWIAAEQGKRREAAKNQADLKKAEERAGRLRDEKARGVRLSRRDAEWLEDFERNKALRKVGRVERAEDAARAARAEQDALNKRIEKLQEEQKKILENIEAYLKESLEVQ